MNLIQRLPIITLGNRLQARQRDLEFAPAPGTLTAGLDGSAMQLDQLSGQRKTDAESALRARQRAIHLSEHFEDVSQHLGRDSWPVVAHVDADLSIMDRHGQPNRAIVPRVLARVVQYVSQ